MTVVKPRMTPLSSIRSTRRLTAGADRFTRCADLGERRTGVLGELGQNPLVGVVQPVHMHSTLLRFRATNYCRSRLYTIIKRIDTQ